MQSGLCGRDEIWRSGVGGSTDGGQGRDEMRGEMRYAICNELFEGWDFGAVAPFVAEAGYAGLELAPFTLGPQPVDLDAAERRRLREAARGHGLALAGL